MKKVIFGIICGAMLCALPFAFKLNVKTTYAMNEQSAEQVVDSEKWTKEDVKEILGYVGAGIGGVATGLMTYLPIYLTIKKAKKRIDEATNGVNAENKSTADLVKRIEKIEDKLENYNKTIEEIHNATKNTEIICRMGFENNNELVSKGIANEISKVGNEDEEHEM